MLRSIKLLSKSNIVLTKSRVGAVIKRSQMTIGVTRRINVFK